MLYFASMLQASFLLSLISKRQLLLYLTLILGTLVQTTPLLAKDSTSLSVPFYSENILLSPAVADSTLFIDHIEEASLVDWYQYQLQEGHYQALLHSLLAQKERLLLNDWLYYELIRATAKELSPQIGIGERLLCWFLLSESGYDTRLTYLEEQVFIYAYSEEGIFDTPMIVDNGRKYINLSSIHERMHNPEVALSLLHFDANARGKSFSFRLQTWPLLEPQIQPCRVAFDWKEQQHILDVQVDLTIAEIMQYYPIFEEYQYLEVPFSNTLSNSLLPQLKEFLQERQGKEALEILAAFTRSAFQYKEDRDYFGKNKPMIADELFHYPYSDCEDRSALFFNLVRQLLDLPMIAIAYPDHLTIAVALDQVIGPAIKYEGRHYYICDPTGPSNSEQIGRIPEGYEDISFEILGKYK